MNYFALIRARVMAAVLAIASLAAMLPTMVQAQDLFAPAVTVNNTVITQYELNQRILFMKVLRQPGDLPKMALDSMIEDRLRADAAKKLGIKLSPDDIKAGMVEFASRANLTPEEFLKAIADGGVEPETFRDFVQAGLLWRSVVRAQFAGKVTVSDAEIDRAIADGAASGGEVKVLLSEIVIPSGGATDAMDVASRLKASIKTPTAFAIAAQNYSKADSAKSGGVLNWILVSALPKEVAAQISALKVGEITGPIVVSNAVELFLLRDISQSAGEIKGVPEVDYARFVGPAGTDLRTLAGRIDTCDDLNPAARGLPAENLQRQTVLESALPGDVRGVITGLDAGETAIIATAAGQPELIMLCSRKPHSDVPPSRDDVRSTILNTKLGLLAAAYMEELRSEAIIRQP